MANRRAILFTVEFAILRPHYANNTAVILKISTNTEERGYRAVAEIKK